MKLPVAITILRTFADGIDPFSGEILPENHIANHPNMIRAVHTLLEALPEKQPSTGATSNTYPNAGQPWTLEDDQTLCAMADQGVPIAVLCKRFLRTRGGITARLVRLGKLEHRNAPYPASTGKVSP